MNWNAVLPVILLAGSNWLMNVALYWHMKVPERPLWMAILGSWLVAFGQYALAVPANRIGAGYYSLAQLKTVQVTMSLVTFVIVAWSMFGTRLGPMHLVGFALIAAGGAVVFRASVA